MNQDVSLKPVDQPLRTMRSDRERKLSVVKVMLQNQYVIGKTNLIWYMHNASEMNFLQLQIGHLALHESLNTQLTLSVMRE